MEKKVINTAHAPEPIGPYNQAVQANGFLFVSGQVALDPATGDMKAGSIEEEAEQVMKNLSAILNEAKMDFNNVIKTTIFLSDMSLFAQVNGIYSRHFSGGYPARETVAVKGLPKNANVEISVIAVR